MQQVRRVAWVAVLFLAAAFVSRGLGQAATQSVPVWLGSGITFAVLLVSARWLWPATLVGAALAAAIWGVVAHGLGATGTLAFAAIEVVSIGLGAWVATLGRQDPEAPAGAALLVAGALLAAVLGGLLAVPFWHWQRPATQPLAEWLAWTCSTGLGLLLIAPVAVAYRGFKVKRSGGMPMAQFVQGGLAFAAFVLAVGVVFGDQAVQRFGSLAATLAYLPMPFLMLAALLWGPRGGTVATLLGSLWMVARTAAGGGPFPVNEDFPGEAVIEVQGFVAIWAIVLLAARALSESRGIALAQAHAWRLRYERTLHAVGVAAVEYDAVTGRATWGQGAAAVLGAAVTEINSVDQWLDRIDPAERGLVQAQWAAVARGDAASSEQTYALRLADGRVQRVHERLAGVRGGDGLVEQVAGLLSLAAAEPARV